MIHYRRMIISLTAVVCIFVLELVHILLTKDPPTAQGMGAIAAVAGVHYWTDRQAKVARIQAGVQEVQA